MTRLSSCCLPNANIDVATQDKDGFTALHYAAWNGHHKVTALLLRARANIATQDKEGWTALHRAAWNGHCQVVNLLWRALTSSTDEGGSPNVSLSEDVEKGPIDVINVLKSLLLTYPNDRKLHRALGNEYMRRKEYIEAKAAYDTSMLVTMRVMGATRIEDTATDVYCDHCGEDIRGYHYKCLRCESNYDMCRRCFQKSNHPHLSDLMPIPSENFSALKA